MSNGDDGKSHCFDSGSHGTEQASHRTGQSDASAPRRTRGGSSSSKNSQRTVGTSCCSIEPVAADFAKSGEDVRWEESTGGRQGLRQAVTVRQCGAEFPEVVQEDCQLHELDFQRSESSADERGRRGQCDRLDKVQTTSDRGRGQRSRGDE